MDFAFKFGNGVRQSLEDGRIDFTDTAFFIDSMIVFPAAITGAGGVVQLFDEFTDEQKATVFAFVEENYPNLAGDAQKDRLVKESLKWAVSTFQLVGGWAGLAKGEEPQA